MTGTTLTYVFLKYCSGLPVVAIGAENSNRDFK